MLRPNSWTQLGQKSSLLFTVTSTIAILTSPPPPHLSEIANWFEPGLWCKHCIREPQVWELFLRLCPETSTKLYIHEFVFWSAAMLRCIHLTIRRFFKECCFWRFLANYEKHLISKKWHSEVLLQKKGVHDEQPLKGLSHEIDFKKFDKNFQYLA